jgi:hypothetical protein
VTSSQLHLTFFPRLRPGLSNTTSSPSSIFYFVTIIIIFFFFFFFFLIPPSKIQPAAIPNEHGESPTRNGERGIWPIW